MHAEAYSAAEVMHGPLALVTPGFPVLALAARDSVGAVDGRDRRRAGRPRARRSSPPRRVPAQAARLPFAATGHPLTDPLALIVSFYAFVEAFARHRGLNPDEPRNLRKVTETRMSDRLAVYRRPDLRRRRAGTTMPRWSCATARSRRSCRATSLAGRHGRRSNATAA